MSNVQVSYNILFYTYMRGIPSEAERSMEATDLFFFVSCGLVSFDSAGLLAVTCAIEPLTLYAYGFQTVLHQYMAAIYIREGEQSTVSQFIVPLAARAAVSFSHTLDIYYSSFSISSSNSM